MAKTTVVEEAEYLSAPAVAKLLRVGHAKVLSWIHNHELSAVDVTAGRRNRPRWRISREQLNAFLARRSVGPNPKARRRRRRQDENVIEFYS